MNKSNKISICILLKFVIIQLLSDLSHSKVVKVTIYCRKFFFLIVHDIVCFIYKNKSSQLVNQKA